MINIDATAIHDALNRDVAERMDQLEIFAEIDSTNTYLMNQSAPGAGRYRVAIADHQTAGRGRHAKRWISAPDSSLCFSLAYTFDGQPDELHGLTLAIGVAARNALSAAGVDGVSLKWPNDLVASDGKLGGMLAETQVRSDRNTMVVAGIGINVDLPMVLLQDNASRWAHRAVDLKALSGEPPPREVIAAELILQLVEALDLFQAAGFGSFVNSWREIDWLNGRCITIERSDGNITGIACGIDDDGALLLKTGASTTRVISGSVILDGLARATE